MADMAWSLWRPEPGKGNCRYSESDRSVHASPLPLNGTRNDRLKEVPRSCGMAAASEIAKERRCSVLRLLGRLVEALDFCALAQLGDEIGLCLARQIRLDLILHLLEFRRLLGALVLDLDDMPA